MRSPAAASGVRLTDGVILSFQTRPADAGLASDLGLNFEIQLAARRAALFCISTKERERRSGSRTLSFFAEYRF